MTIECIIYYLDDKEDNENKLFDKYCRDFEDMGFVLENTIELKSMNKIIAKYSYHKTDFKNDIEQIKSLDERIKYDYEKNYFTLP